MNDAPKKTRDLPSTRRCRCHPPNAAELLVIGVQYSFSFHFVTCAIQVSRTTISPDHFVSSVISIDVVLGSRNNDRLLDKKKTDVV